MKPSQEDTRMEKHPNSRMCFVCGIDKPVGLHLKFCTNDEGRCIARFQPKPGRQGNPDTRMGVRRACSWTSGS